MANNITIKDANGSDVTVQSTDNGSVQLPAHQLRSSDGSSALTIAAGVASVSAAQSGTWNVTNVSGTVSLPTGASTAAKQPAPGTAGTASADVLTVQGITSMTPLLATLSGTNNINTVSTVTTVSSVSALPALAAGTNLVGRISASDETSTVYSGTTALTPKFATITASSSGNNTVVASPGAVKIRVLAVQMIASGTVNAKWQSAAGGTDITGLAYLVANAGYVLPYNPVGWFETATSALLNLNLSAGTAVGGSIVYVEV